MEKISVSDFVNAFNNYKKGNELSFNGFIKKHIVVDYVGYLQKDAICEGIVRATSYLHDTDKEEHNVVRINSTMRYLFFIMKLIDIYTDIDINNDNIAADYDALNKVGAISVLIQSIPETEYKAFKTMLNMKLDDLRDNEYSITSMIYNWKKSLSLSEEVINGALEQFADENITK